MPRAASEAISSLRPSFGARRKRELFFEAPHRLKNAIGHSFSLQVNLLKRGPPMHEVFLERKSGCPLPCLTYMKFETSAKKNKVCLAQIYAINPMAVRRSSIYEVPSRENRGYGFMRIALFFGSHLANREGISRLTITPASSEVGHLYQTYGFSPQCFEAEKGTEIEEMVLHLGSSFGRR